MPLQTTLILFKPDTISKGLCGAALTRFEAAGLKIRGIRMLQFEDSLLREHYAHIASKPFFPEVVRFMQSTPIIALALSAPDAVQKVRDLLGPTDSAKAAKGTIRGDFGKDVMANVCHASDSAEAADTEVKRFFPEDSLFDY